MLPTDIHNAFDSAWELGDIFTSFVLFQCNCIQVKGTAIWDPDMG